MKTTPKERSESSQGLYDPRFEHDACGVGFVCRVNNEASREIVELGLELLSNLDHRGATGADPDTGDGAGITIQIPYALMTEVAAEQSLVLPGPGDYGTGLVFLPRDPEAQTMCRGVLEKMVRREGQHLLGWRQVPTHSEAIGETARAAEPDIWQVFIAKNKNLDPESFASKLFVIRKSTQRWIWQHPFPGSNAFHVVSLSAETMVFKGMLTSRQLGKYYADLADPRIQSAFALVHSRFSTNTFPSWPLAQPFRFLCHNGEINTVRGNAHWMQARQGLFQSDKLGVDLSQTLPVLDPDSSDSGKLDNALELLYHTGRSLPHAVMMLMPEAWEQNPAMPDSLRAFYEYHSCLMEPWDGPAMLGFTDGRYVGAALDRNGLRPSRYTVTSDGLVVLASESGVLPIDPATVVEKRRLKPGKMILVDLKEHRIISDEEIKLDIAGRQPYREWLNAEMVAVDDLPGSDQPGPAIGDDSLRQLQVAFGYTDEAVPKLIGPMAKKGKESLGSMGDDTPIAALSNRPRLLYDYFQQLFAQVTNPPLDAIREVMVTSLQTNLGGASNIFQEAPQHCRMIRLKSPILTVDQLQRIVDQDRPGLRTTRLSTLFDAGRGEIGLKDALDRLCEAAADSASSGDSILILSDRSSDQGKAAIPALLACGAVHHHLIRESLRTKVSLVIESGEPHEVHHHALLIGYGAEAICPYVALETAATLAPKRDAGVANYVRAVSKGILKIMSKMGISTVQSYCGAQVFEALGIGSDLIDSYFAGTSSRIGGIGLDVVAKETLLRHEAAFSQERGAPELAVGGRYEWRRNGERHAYGPEPIARLQDAVRRNRYESYESFSRLANQKGEEAISLRGLLELHSDRTPVPLEEVEPWTEIVKRFKTGAMSYGSISQETHETLAEAMNSLGGKSNTGEGGEDPSRYKRSSKQRSRIKQVASGRFGVTIDYLASADEIQIKMAQGAKPGEGGQLPGEKVFPWIAKVRHSTPYVGLISPPPHHDIYSIEDLAQLIYDLKCANPIARISVKLVSECGVGTIAAGVAKAKADVILISGHDGGSGAAPKTSLAHAGIPWELGLSETHQTLVMNGLRSRVRLECDGQLKTGRDVAIACLMGADEFGFSTAPLIALGCIMMRKCHLNTCPVGIATQNPTLRAKFSGKPEHVVNYFHFVAEELRSLMATLGFRTVEEMTGHVEVLRAKDNSAHWKAKTIDVSRLLFAAEPKNQTVLPPQDKQHVAPEASRDGLIARIMASLDRSGHAHIDLAVSNTNRAFGTKLSAAITSQFPNGLPNDDAVSLRLIGTAGQSFMAFGAAGITARLEGAVNDFCGKGLSGSKLVIVPPKESVFAPEDNIIVGNVAFYGATSGSAFIQGQAGERFCVRNSGVTAVVEGVGDHGCEYMTGGCVVVLGPTGRNFAAGMSGGIAYVLDGTWDFRRGRCNEESVILRPLDETDDAEIVRQLIARHRDLTGSTVAAWALDNWSIAVQQFVKVVPTEYEEALRRLELEPKPTDATEHIAA